MLSRKQIIEVLISLCRCAGLSEPLLFECNKPRFSRDMAHYANNGTVDIYARHKGPISNPFKHKI